MDANKDYFKKLFATYGSALLPNVGLQALGISALARGLFKEDEKGQEEKFKKEERLTRKPLRF